MMNIKIVNNNQLEKLYEKLTKMSYQTRVYSFDDDDYVAFLKVTGLKFKIFPFMDFEATVHLDRVTDQIKKWHARFPMKGIYYQISGNINHYDLQLLNNFNVFFENIFQKRIDKFLNGNI